ncbi:MAG: ribosomal protein S18-alanine N-acetyltransferase [Blastocatellia bacterium]|nr:ribosomal protein S18-alanine N-acetyltransferase [Blastocatellia bacterium]MCS7157154.1 ribosomal protein S18-alanine N-acetyltransferase [Blastocatellia bacterium]MCX7752383.1 ribosomal protein S18-alanine N-acetyltransferase [Blastocatellia bacterium]
MNTDDLPEVVEIEELSHLSRWGAQGYARELALPERSILLVARPMEAHVPRRVLGFLCSTLVLDEWHIHNLATHPNFRRQGIARALLLHGRAMARERGARYALLEVRASNLPAQRLYQQLGFYVFHRRKGYYADPPEDALLMRCNLSETSTLEEIAP